MADWNLFAGVSIFLTVAMLFLARVTADALTSPEADDTAEFKPNDSRPPSPAERTMQSSMDEGALLTNAAISHGLLGLFLVGIIWYAQVPLSALGIGIDGRAILLGIGLGLALSVANEGGARLAERLGFDADEELRELLAPDSLGGWVLLLVAVLPTIAVVEELLFRAALIGGLATGYGLPVWLLAVASSMAFGLGHGLQGPGGVVVTGLLGFVLAVAFVATGSLLVVVVAHYLVNALEFVVHEGLDRDGSGDRGTRAAR